MTRLSQVPAQPKSRRSAPSYPRTLMGIGAMMLMAACGGSVDNNASSGEGGSAGVEAPSGAAPYPYDAGNGGTAGNGGAVNPGVGGSSGGGAPGPYGGSGGDQVGGAGGEPNPAGDIAEPFDAGPAGSGGGGPDGDIAVPFDAGAGGSSGAAGAGGALSGEAPFPYEDGGTAGTAGSCNTGGSGGL